MFANNRKRARSDGPAQEQDGSASSAALSGPLRPHTVNTVQDARSGDGSQGNNLQPLLKKSGGRTGSSVAHDAQTNSGSASERSSTSQSHTAPAVRGKPHRPLHPGQCPVASSSSVISTSRGRTAAAVAAVHNTGAPSTKHRGLSLKQNNRGHSETKTASTTASPASAADAQLHATWRLKRRYLEEEVHLLEQQSTQLSEEAQAFEDAIEGMLTQFEEDKRLVEVHHANNVARYQGLMKALRTREDVCFAAKQRALSNIATSVEAVRELSAQQAKMQEAIILATDECETLSKKLSSMQATEAERVALLQQLQGEEERMKDATYGLSGEVRELVAEMERLRVEKRKAETSAMETEVARRELYSLCEELKGSIRVYCRVKGSAKVVLPTAVAASKAPLELPTPTAIKEPAVKVDNDGAHGTGAPPSPAKVCRGGSVESSVSAGVRSTAGAGAALAGTHSAPASGAHSSWRSNTRSTVSTAVTCAEEVGAAVDNEGDRESERCLFSYPDRTGTEEVDAVYEETTQPPTILLSTLTTLPVASEAPADVLAPRAALVASEDAVGAEAGLPYSCGRCITVHQTRSNATSTGVNNTEESFTYDRVFPGSSNQEDVYRDVEPLVRNAVDGYRVCVFAYGQTGSGKTFTMEGDLSHTPAAYGVTPRALQTILQRQEELAKEGWSYELSCTFIEIYNDVIRDLFQSGSPRYEASVQQSSNPATYHTIKHSGDCTQITNVSEKRIRNMKEFFTLYSNAVDQRRTAKTDLNDKSSRSHCIFTLYITGTNATINQRSEGVLCLVDLAGSERVNESGVQGKQFKEAVNINRSLLDLGKCIRALRSGAVVPWRNCKLTFLLQNHLGAKGGKMLMIVTVSNLRQHASETLNSLRFAARVQETFVGTSVRRVVNMM
ncbi:putative C-terminal motor kinesin [Leptomonas seymouri]|uniref:Kinesin-like protein n=1 Tax=Leptomonas seymouri TaxID=5684 RepID=A0A0N1IAP4_LEPSE|nr:putative C-terminal motor kinesin [Leptomonas seymouri]|eukprot:KPI89472.1 putative C-terminal motor kinesin [Leptomonas seymouri]